MSKQLSQNRTWSIKQIELCNQTAQVSYLHPKKTSAVQCNKSELSADTSLNYPQPVEILKWDQTIQLLAVMPGFKFRPHRATIRTYWTHCLRMSYFCYPYHTCLISELNIEQIDQVILTIFNDVDYFKCHLLPNHWTNWHIILYLSSMNPCL